MTVRHESVFIYTIMAHMNFFLNVGTAYERKSIFVGKLMKVVWKFLFVQSQTTHSRKKKIFTVSCSGLSEICHIFNGSFHRLKNVKSNLQFHAKNSSSNFMIFRLGWCTLAAFDVSEPMNILSWLHHLRLIFSIQNNFSSSLTHWILIKFKNHFFYPFSLWISS